MLPKDSITFICELGVITVLNVGMYRLIITLTLISTSTTDIVKWVPRASFNMPSNYEGGKLPCSRQIVVFPESVDSSIDLEADVSLSGIVLPYEGVLYLESGSIYFGANPNDNCSNDGFIEYIGKTSAAWNQPDVWSSDKFNKATPDSERIPCFDDVVQFPVHNSVSCQLPDEVQQIRRMQMGNDESNNELDEVEEMYDYLFTGNHQNFVFNKIFNMGIEFVIKSCTSRSGCPCQQRFMKIDCSLKFCPLPTCVAPIQPLGHCCKICGGALLFNISRSFDLLAFKQLVKKTLSSYGGLVFHIGRIANKVQLVVVEEDDYDGRSSEAVNELSYLTESGWVHSEKKALLSGTPLYKYGLGGKLFVSMFFVVIFVMGLVYGYYYKLPDIRNPIMGRGWFNVGALARFQRRSESVVSLTRRDSMAPGFRNPLYDSKRGRVQVTESVVED